jgi:hypothetical protein
VAITGGVLLIGMQYLCSLTTWRANRCEAEERYAPVELRFIQRIKWKEEVTGSSLRFFVEIWKTLFHLIPTTTLTKLQCTSLNASAFE